MAGITTFMAMAYILMVNANMFTEISVSYGAVYIATALSAVIGTLCMGLIAKLPLALASGMGINAFFVYTVCIGSGLTYANALVLIFFEGILMINCVTSIDWKDVEVAVPAFLTMAFMPFTYNVSYGIAFGMISYIIIKIGLGKIKEIKIGTWIIAILFAVMFFVTH